MERRGPHLGVNRVAKKSGRNAKVKKVLNEFKKGKLKSSSGTKVTKRKQAIAIALSEAGLSKKKRTKKVRKKRR